MSEQSGIEQQLDAGVAEQDHQDERAVEDLQPGTVVDPDDTEESLREVTEESEHPR